MNAVTSTHGETAVTTEDRPDLTISTLPRASAARNNESRFRRLVVGWGSSTSAGTRRPRSRRHGSGTGRGLSAEDRSVGTPQRTLGASRHRDPGDGARCPTGSLCPPERATCVDRGAH
jgi:hypothetical protein